MMNREQRDRAKQLTKELRERTFALSDALIRNEDEEAGDEMDAIEKLEKELRDLIE